MKNCKLKKKKLSIIGRHDKKTNNNKLPEISSEGKVNNDNKNKKNTNRYRSSLIISHLTDEMSADEAAEVIRLRFNDLALPSLRGTKIEEDKQEESASSSEYYTSDDEVDLVDHNNNNIRHHNNHRKAWSNQGGGIQNSNALTFKNGAVLWKIRTTQPESGQMLLPTHNCGILYDDEGIQINQPLDTTFWRVNNSVLVQISRRLPKLTEIILESPECTSLSVFRKLKYLNKLIIKNAHFLERKAFRRFVPKHRSRLFGKGMLLELDVSNCGKSVEDRGMTAVAEHHRLLQILHAGKTVSKILFP